MGKSISFEVPLPPRGLSGNKPHGYHWGKEASARKLHREECGLIAKNAVRQARWKPPPYARLDMTFYIKGSKKVERYSPLDPTNAVTAAKALVDGLVDGKVLLKDDYHHLKLGEIDISNTDGPFVRITVEEIEKKSEPIS